MSFDPLYEIGQVLKNNDIVEKFKCGNMGGMRRSHTTNTLVLITDYTKGIYHDKWIGGVLHYTGMGKNGDQDKFWLQNATLTESKTNGVDLHLFEVINEGDYIYCGRVELVEEPYIEIQPGEDGIDRKVWMFPIKPIPDNDVIKPDMFVFKDIEDFKKNGKNVDERYNNRFSKTSKKRSSNRNDRILGKKVLHKKYGLGTVSKFDEVNITVNFVSEGTKKLDYKLCIDNNIISFVE